MPTREMLDKEIYNENLNEAGIYDLDDPVSRLVTSLPSSAVTIVDIPEVSNLSVEFNYNFFVKNERTSDQGDFLFLDDTMSSNEKAELNRKRTIPRFNKISFSPPNICGPVGNSNDDFLAQIKKWKEFSIDLANSVSIRKYYNDLMYEEAISNARFSSVHIHDTGADKAFYTLVQGSPEYFSPQTLDYVLRGTKGFSKFYSDSLFSRKASTPAENIANALSNIQIKGYRYAEKGNRTAVAGEAFFGPKGLEYNFNVNNLFAHSLMRAAAEDGTNVYNDEIATLLQDSRGIQTNTRETTNAGIINISDYIPGIIPIEQIGPIPTSTARGIGYNEASVLIGYVIEKREILKNGGIKFHKDIIVENPKQTTVIDPKIKYGASYQYKVRAVTLSQFEALQVDPMIMDSEGIVIARCTIASRGRSGATVCVETLPPPPPDEINFHYDYERDNLIFTWGFPVNPQRDIKKFQIFRRRTTRQRFELLGEYDFDNSTVKTKSPEFVDKRLVTKMRSAITYFVDTEFTKESSFIYAACAIDAHGLSSNYSEQFRVRFDIYKNRIIKNRLSQCGAPKPYPNLYLDRDLFVDTIKASGYDKIKVYFDPEHLVVKNKDGSKAKFIATGGEDNPSYFMTILNCDLQESEIVEISVSDRMRKGKTEFGAEKGVKIRTLGIKTGGGLDKGYKENSSDTGGGGVSSS